jgi:hypothetical protein
VVGKESSLMSERLSAPVPIHRPYGTVHLSNDTGELPNR